jgi:general secretion pathway protein C
MKNITNSKLFSTLLFFLTVLVIAKLVWLIISIEFLPKSGVEYREKNKLKAFYYPVRLSNSKKNRPKVVVAPTATKRVKPKKIVGNMKDYRLLALYNTRELLVVTVAKGATTKVLAQGEIFNGFKLKSAERDYALFDKNGKEFKLYLKNIKLKKAKKSAPKRVTKAVSHSVKQKGIVATDDGATKIVSKGLLSSYTKDIDKVWKDIGIGEHKVNGVLTGFKVNFIKRHSDFEKLGLKRGDILTAINGQELDSYNAAFSFYKEMDSIENLTLSIKRNNQEMELEYEIQ